MFRLKVMNIKILALKRSTQCALKGKRNVHHTGHEFNVNFLKDALPLEKKIEMLIKNNEIMYFIL